MKLGQIMPRNNDLEIKIQIDSNQNQTKFPAIEGSSTSPVGSGSSGFTGKDSDRALLRSDAISVANIPEEVTPPPVVNLGKCLRFNNFNLYLIK